MEPLGLRLNERPRGRLRDARPRQPGFDYRLHGPTVLAANDGAAPSPSASAARDAGASEVTVVEPGCHRSRRARSWSRCTPTRGDRRQPHRRQARELALRPLARRAPGSELSRDPAQAKPQPCKHQGRGGDRTQGRRQALRPDRAVDGLDLDVPEGICLGLLGPNGAGKSTTMRLLTGQAIADAGELRVLGHELPERIEGRRARDGRRPAARQPRRRRHRRGQPRRLRAPLPGPRRRRRGRPRARPRAPARPPPRRRRQALGRDAAAAAARPRPRPRAAAGPARRADRRPRPADPDRALDADRRAQSARHDDPDVDPLHRGGRAARRRGGGDDHGQGDQPRPPGRPDRRARRPPDRRGLRAAASGSPSCGPRPRRAGLRVRAGRAGDRDRRLRAGRERRSSPRTRWSARPRSRTSSSC